MAQKLVPEAKESLAKFKNEVANDMGVQFSDYNGNLSSKECGSVGGEMVKRMVESYEQKHTGNTMENSVNQNSNHYNGNQSSNSNYNNQSSNNNQSTKNYNR